MRGRRTQRLGRLWSKGGVAPEDRGTALGADHRIGGILLHEHPVGHGKGQRAAGAAFADDRGDDRHGEARHRQHRLGDGPCLATFLGGHAGVGAGRVHKGQHRQTEALGQREQSLRLAVALGLGLAEVVGQLLVQGLALLVADDEHGPVVEPADAADHGGVIGPQAIALELLEAMQHSLDVVSRARPVLVPRDLDRQPGVVAALLMRHPLQARLQLFDLFRQMDAGHV